MNDFIVIPQDGKSIIAKIEDSIVKEIREIDIPYKSKSIITDKDLVVSLCFDSNAIDIHTLTGELLQKMENTNFKAINYKNNVIYLGGQADDRLTKRFDFPGEMFSVLNLDEVKFTTTPVELPIKIIEGKSIDDILVYENDLILVDNCVYPKYLLRYDISIPQNPKYISTEGLPNNGTYEHIIKGDINKHWMILYSSTVGRGGSSEHISVSGKKRGYLSLHHSFDTFRTRIRILKSSEKLYYRDIALINNRLFILRSDGLGFINLEKRISNTEFRFLKTKISNITRIIKSKSDKLIAINENEYELIDTTNCK